MGHTVGKPNKSDIAIFTAEEERTICEYFGSGLKPHCNIDPAIVKRRWDEIMPPTLCKQLHNYVFRQELRATSLDRFTSLYVRLVRENNDVKAVTLMRVVSMDYFGDPGDLPTRYLIEFARNMVSSYLNILTSKGHGRVRSWMAAKVELNTEETKSLAKYLCKDMETYENMFGLGQMEAWLYRCGLLGEIMETVLNCAYNLKNPQKNEVHLPQASIIQNFTTILDMSQIIFLNSCVPSENRSRWRLLFSVRTHGESWTKFTNQIQRQGATVIVIRDKDNYLFGGFSSQSWKMWPQFYGDNYSFLFTLKPEMEKFEPSSYNNNYQYLNSGQQTLPNGLGMGGQFHYWGLFIDSEFTKGKCSESCSTFRGYRPLAAATKFKIADLEVWGVGKPDLTPEELGERSVEGSSSALSQDRTAEALLEMAGVEFYSKRIGPEEPDPSLD